MSQRLERTAILAFTLMLLCLGTPPGRAAQPKGQTDIVGPKKLTPMVTMSDGIRLATDVYLPFEKGRFPVILLRTPYDKSAGTGIGMDGARRGYAIVVQDTRGRFASSGENLPFEGDGWAEHADGYDTLEWITAQSWCNGKIGTFGGSALGITQIGMAGSGTTRLTSQHITVAPPGMYHYGVYPGGVFKKAMIEDWLQATKHDPAGLKLWTLHPTYDAFWKTRDLASHWERADAPAVHLGGWYDIFSQGTLDAFNGYQNRGGRNARGKQWLIMGPWTHGVLQETAGELTYPKGQTPTGNVADAWRWFDATLKGTDNGILGLPKVTYYVMGDASDPTAPGNVWRTADTWPPFPTQPTALYLTANHTLVEAPHVLDSPLTYTYDPKDPVPTVGGPQLTLPAGPRDQRKIESRPDVLVFTGAPLQTPLEVTGHVYVHLTIASDAPDTDFAAKLCDVYPDGRVMNVCEGILRARFRNGFEEEHPLKPGKPTQLTLDLWSTSIVFNKGHRLQVLVTSSNAPGFDPNPNTGEPFRKSNRTRVAHNTVFFNERSPSYILLPVAPTAYKR